MMCFDDDNDNVPIDDDDDVCGDDDDMGDTPDEPNLSSLAAAFSPTLKGKKKKPAGRRPAKIDPKVGPPRRKSTIPVLTARKKSSKS